MQKSGVAKRYAKAAFELALEENELGKWLEEIESAAQVMLDPQVADVMQNVKVRRTDKQQLVTRLLPDLRPLVRNLVLLLVSKDRTSIIGDIAREYEKLVNDHRGVAIAEVTTAVPVDEGEKAILVERLSRMTGKRIVLQTRVDPEIVGGLVARIGDKVVDGSLKTRLLLLRRNLLGVAR